MKKRILYYLFILLLFPHNGTGQTVARMSDRPVNTSQWITTHFARGVVPPFSFEYGGKPSQEFIKSWSYTATRQKSDDPKVLKCLYTYREPSGGLKVECERLYRLQYGGMGTPFHQPGKEKYAGDCQRKSV